jgi:hypothetical protein
MTDPQFGPNDRDGLITDAQHLEALREFSTESLNLSKMDRVVELCNQANELIGQFLESESRRTDPFMAELAEVATALRDSFRAWAEKLGPIMHELPDQRASTYFTGAVHAGGALEMALWVLTPEKFDNPRIAQDPEAAKSVLEGSLETVQRYLSKPSESEQKWWQSPPELEEE